MRAKRKSFSSEQQNTAARNLLVQLKYLSEFDAAGSIAMYLVNDGEIDPIEAMRWCWGNQKNVYVPVVTQSDKNSLVFAPVHKNTEFQENKFGIREPIVDIKDIEFAENLDLVLMPLVAFDQQGNRVGMGGGFYDTTFEFLKNNELLTPTLVGIAHEIQKVEDISAEYWDIPLGTIVTDAAVYRI